jgi:hypothetical protein
MPELLALPKSETSQSQPVDSSPICHDAVRFPSLADALPKPAASTHQPVTGDFSITFG